MQAVQVEHPKAENEPESHLDGVALRLEWEQLYPASHKLQVFDPPKL